MTAESHRDLRELVGAYALGQLSGQRWQDVHDHLQVCAACSAELDGIAPVAGLLATARDRLRPDDLTGEPDQGPPLSEDLLAQVRASSGASPGVPSLDARRRRKVPRGRWLAAAAAVGVVLAGGVGFVAGGATASDGPLETVAVRTFVPAVQAQAALVPHTWGMEVKLTATGFDVGEVFAVSVTDDAGRVVDAGEFIGTGDGRMLCNLSSSVLRADASLVQVTTADGEVVLDAPV